MLLGRDAYVNIDVICMYIFLCVEPFPWNSLYLHIYVCIYIFIRIYVWHLFEWYSNKVKYLSISLSISAHSSLPSLSYYTFRFFYHVYTVRYLNALLVFIQNVEMLAFCENNNKRNILNAIFRTQTIRHTFFCTFNVAGSLNTSQKLQKKKRHPLRTL